MLNSRKYLASLLLALFLPGVASATLIDYEVVSDAGGFVDDVDCNFGNGTCDIAKEFDGILPISIRFFVDSTAGSLFITEDVFNDTGIDWTDYHYQVTPEGISDRAITFESYFDQGEFTTISAFGASRLDVAGGSGVPDFSGYIPDLRIDYAAANGQSSFLFTQVPTIAVPEPTTLLLMGIGLTGLGFARRRRLNA